MITLRDYQDRCYQLVRQAMATYRRILLQLPTGGGKTAIAAAMTYAAANKGKRIYFICHRQELLDQTAKTYAKCNFNYISFIASGLPYNPNCPVQICSIDTLKNRMDKVPEPDLCLWDEAHHLGAAGWSKVQAQWTKCWHLGLSATPERLDGKGLEANFDHMVLGPSTCELMDLGHLSDYRLFAPPGPDLSGLHTRMGDFVKGEAEAAMDKSSITGDIIAHWKQHAYGKRTIVFAVSVKHSQHIAEQFRQAGIMAIHLDGKTPKAERKAAAQSFAKGDIQVLCNVDLFGEGYDLAAQAGMDVTVDCVVMARPTQSLALFLQQVGRCLRPKDDGSRAIILDHAGNCMRHGLPDDERQWTLAGHQRKGRQKDQENMVSIRQCPECFATHRPAPRCPECGHIYVVNGRELKEVEGDLEEVDRDAIRRQARAAQAKAKDLESLVALGMSEGRAKHIIEARREKAYLRTQLYNLWQGAFLAGAVDKKPSESAIRDLKPKELKEKIATIIEMMPELAVSA